MSDLDPSIQVKLLRVLESRELQCVGEAHTRVFRGRVITATHRDIPARIAAGAFREDLYYRLNAHTCERVLAGDSFLPARTQAGRQITPDAREHAIGDLRRRAVDGKDRTAPAA